MPTTKPVLLMNQKKVARLFIGVIFLSALLAAQPASAATFIPATHYGTGSAAGAYSTATGDFDNDGDADVALANPAGGAISIFRANGDGTFTWTGTDYSVGATPDAVIVGNFNGDANLDLATANGVDNTISILLGNGDGTFSAATPLTTTTRTSSFSTRTTKAKPGLDPFA